MVWVIAVFGCHFLFAYDLKDIKTSTISRHVCVPKRPFFEAFHQRVWPFLVLLLASVLPVPLIVISNSVIFLSMFVQRKRLTTLYPTVSGNKQKFLRKTKSLARLVCLLSAFFIATSIPYLIYKVVISFDTIRNKTYYAK